MFGLEGIELSIIIVFGCLIIGILSGFPVAFALAGSAMVSMGIILSLSSLEILLDEAGNPLINDTSQTIYRNIALIPNRIFSSILGGPSVDVLLAVPLFVFMGITLERSQIAEDLLTTMAAAFGTFPGGLTISVVVVGALLAASTGIVGATVVTMGLLSLPTMLRNGYSPQLATGTICASGTLGQIIPPSIVLVLLGQQVGEIYSQAHPGEVISVGTLFKSAMIPGLLLVLLYIGYILWVALRHPEKAPAVQHLENQSEHTETQAGALKRFFFPALLILFWILLYSVDLAGAQIIKTGDQLTSLIPPISGKVAGLALISAIVISLSWVLFPSRNRLVGLLGAAGVISIILLDYGVVHPQTSPGSAFWIYSLPMMLIIFSLATACIQLRQNKILRVVFPPLVLIIAVLGSILGGLTNPTAAAGLGACGAIMLASVRMSGTQFKRWPIFFAAVAVIALLMISGSFDIRMQVTSISGENQVAIFVASVCYYLFLTGFFYACYILLKCDVMKQVMLQTAKITSMVFVILIGSQMLNLVLKSFGGDEYIQDILRQFQNEHVTLLVVLLVIFVMGFVLDFLEIIYIVIPIVGPVIFGGDLDPRWVTILIAVNLQTSFLTPPFGFALFYLRGVAPPEVKTKHIYQGILPFVLIQILALAILWFFEPITTFLPDLLPEGGR